MDTTLFLHFYSLVLYNDELSQCLLYSSTKGLKLAKNLQPKEAKKLISRGSKRCQFQKTLTSGPNTALSESNYLPRKSRRENEVKRSNIALNESESLNTRWGK